MMGAPGARRGQERDHALLVRLSDAEHHELSAAALRLGIPRAALMRIALSSFLRRENGAILEEEIR